MSGRNNFVYVFKNGWITWILCGCVVIFVHIFIYKIVYNIMSTNYVNFGLYEGCEYGQNKSYC